VVELEDVRRRVHAVARADAEPAVDFDLDPVVGRELAHSPLRLTAPEARLQPRPGPVQADVDVIAMRQRLIEVALPAPAPVVAVRVAAHPLLTGPPGAAVPDDLL